MIEGWEYWEGSPLTVWTDPILRIEVIYLALETVVYLALAVLLDRWSTNPRMVSIGHGIKSVLTCGCYPFKRPRPTDITVALPEDEDVLEEQERVLEGRANNDLIVMSELKKIYDNGKKAVDNFSLGIPAGECFGLLGINGKCAISWGAVPFKKKKQIFHCLVDHPSPRCWQDYDASDAHG